MSTGAGSLFAVTSAFGGGGHSLESSSTQSKVRVTAFFH